MTLIPIMIPLQRPGQVSPILPDAGTGLFFDAQKRRFDSHSGLSIRRWEGVEIRHGAVLRKYAHARTRLFSGLSRKAGRKADSSIILGRRSKNPVKANASLRRKQD